MITENILNALNIQMNRELLNSLIYKTFSGIADIYCLNGTSKWFEIQSKEEMEHFNKFFNYICKQGNIPQITTIPDICNETLSFADLFVKSIELEENTTHNLKLVSELCKEENDDQTFELILWFLKEQVEEEDMVRTIHERILMSLNDPLRVDSELGERK